MRATYNHIDRPPATRPRPATIAGFRPEVGNIGRALLTEGSPGPLHDIRDTRERR